MIEVRFKIDYSQGIYGKIAEVFERHAEMIRGYAALLEVFEEKSGHREYLCEFEDTGDGWTARGLAEELLHELTAEGWPVEMERVVRSEA